MTDAGIRKIYIPRYTDFQAVAIYELEIEIEKKSLIKLVAVR